MRYIVYFGDSVTEFLSERILNLINKVGKAMVDLKRKETFKRGAKLLCQDDEFKNLISQQQEYIEILVAENERLREHILDLIFNQYGK